MIETYGSFTGDRSKLVGGPFSPTGTPADTFTAADTLRTTDTVTVAVDFLQTAEVDVPVSNEQHIQAAKSHMGVLEDMMEAVLENRFSALSWVSPLVSEILVELSQSVPTDATITPELLQLPPSGLLLFSGDGCPVLDGRGPDDHFADEEGGTHVTITAIAWNHGYVSVGPEAAQTSNLPEGEHECWMVWPMTGPGEYVNTTMHPHTLRQPALSYCNPIPVPYTTKLENMATAVRDAISLFMSFALWQQQSKPTPATDRPSQRAAKKADKKGNPSTVLCHKLKRLDRAPTDLEETKNVDWSCQWMVSPHWRKQRYGPGRAWTKPVLIPPHVKGPPDKPLKWKNRLIVLDRE